MVIVFANSGDPDQTPRFAASDLGLHCLPVILLGYGRGGGGGGWGLQTIMGKQACVICSSLFLHQNISRKVRNKELTCALTKTQITLRIHAI